MKIIEHSLFRKAWHRMTIHNDSQLLSHYSNISVEQRQRGQEQEPILTDEEHEEYVSNSITRDKKVRFESKMGKQIYAFGRYKKLSRATIPIITDAYYMLLIFDAKTIDFDDVIMKKLVPLIEKERHRFTVVDDDG
jgi:hypothetical protein